MRNNYKFNALGRNTHIHKLTHTLVTADTQACTHPFTYTHSQATHTAHSHVLTHMHGTHTQARTHTLYFASFSEEKGVNSLIFRNEVENRLLHRIMLLECSCMFDKIELKSVNCFPTPRSLSSNQ